MLRDNEIITVTVDVGPVGHVFVAHVGVSSDTFSESWFTRSCDGLDSGHEVDIVSLGDIERQPSELSGGDMHFGVERKETSLGVWIVGHGVVSLMSDSRTHTVEPCMLI